MEVGTLLSCSKEVKKAPTLFPFIAPQKVPWCCLLSAERIVSDHFSDRNLRGLKSLVRGHEPHFGFWKFLLLPVCLLAVCLGCFWTALLVSGPPFGGSGLFLFLLPTWFPSLGAAPPKKKLVMSCPWDFFKQMRSTLLNIINLDTNRAPTSHLHLVPCQDTKTCSRVVMIKKPSELGRTASVETRTSTNRHEWTFYAAASLSWSSKTNKYPKVSHRPHTNVSLGVLSTYHAPIGLIGITKTAIEVAVVVKCD